MKSKEPLKVCLITPHYPPEFGWYGQGRDAMELAEELHARGCHVEVIACAEKLTPGETWQDGIKVIRTDWRSKGSENGLVAHSLPQARVLMNINLSAWHAYLQSARTSEFDIVDVAGFSAESLIPAIMSDCPVVASVYDNPPAFLSREMELIGDSGFKFEKLISASLATLSSKCVSGVSTIGAEKIQGDHFEKRNYSLDTQAFSPEGPSAIDTKGRPALLIHSSIQSDKYKTLVSEIVSRVKKEIPDLWLTVVAHDIFSESSESEMKAALAQSGIECDMVINHVMARLLMPGLWRSSLCGLILDWEVMAPYAVLEPLACGKPVVAENQSAAVGYLSGKEFVRQPSDFNVDDVASILIQMIKDETLRTRLGNESRNYILANHCRKSNADRIVIAYEKAIEKFKAKGRHEKIERIEKVLDQIKSIAQGLDQWLYDLLFVRSFRFRVSHWLKKFRKNQPAGRR
ncbi:MAG: glycosyltransferase family 4 protein [Candidatus Obscuribacterales bacterium]|nr:glycosyltransferase family 4 protein [Candidatus Obscuribacterales bacterium]